MVQKTERDGYFGAHDGQCILETLMSAVIELEETYERYKDDPKFDVELAEFLNEYARRPNCLYHIKYMTESLSDIKIYLKRKDLSHTGTHGINNALDQALLTKCMGKRRPTTETDAGQHGVAIATVATPLNMEYVIYMGEEDTVRQTPNVHHMCLLGAKIVTVETRTKTLKNAISEVIREWTVRIEDTHYYIGSCMGPHPFPAVVHDFQAVIPEETEEEIQWKEECPPGAMTTYVGSGSNIIDSFYHSVGGKSMCLIGYETAGRGVHTMETAAAINMGSLGIFHEMGSYFRQDKYGQIAPTYSISAGFDYLRIGPEHACLHDLYRTEHIPVTGHGVVDAFEYLAWTEDIIPTIENAHAVACVRKLAPAMDRDKMIVVTLSGRSDKDVAAIAHYGGEDLHK